MAAVTLLEQFEVVPNSAIKTILFTLANTVDATDTLAITLSDHGISATGLLTVNGWVHTTDGSYHNRSSNLFSCSRCLDGHYSRRNG